MSNSISAIANLPQDAAVAIFTDGASLNNPGPAAWGLVAIHEGKPIHSASAAIGKASNIVAEMTGALEAARLLQDRPDLSATIVTDNEMLFKGMNEWRFGWKRNGWRKTGGKALANLDLWKQLDAIASALPLLKWQWVRGHAGNVFNEMADVLASDAAANQ